MYIFLGIDVDNQFLEFKNKAKSVGERIYFKNSCFVLPLHISLKAAFKIEDSIFDNAIEDIVNYYSTIEAFKIDISKLEMYDNIIWVRMIRNKMLDKVHDGLNKMLLDKYNIPLHEYDLDYKYHTTFFMDDDAEKIKEAYSLIKNVKLPQCLTANRFIIGVSETGELGSYRVHKCIKK